MVFTSLCLDIFCFFCKKFAKKFVHPFERQSGWSTLKMLFENALSLDRPLPSPVLRSAPTSLAFHALSLALCLCVFRLSCYKRSATITI